MSHECKNLDAFLADDLSDDFSEHFAAHLAHCPACRDAVDQQRWIDGLLTSPGRIELEPLPRALPDSVRTSIAWRRRKMSAIACGLAAAAVLIVAVGWTALLSRQAREAAVRETAIGAIGAAEPSPSPFLGGRGLVEPPRATFVGGPEVIVVPVQSSHPNVTVVRVYPAYRPRYPAQASASSPAGGDDFTWPLDLNGG